MGLGLGEIILILLAALIVVGPKRLPGLARSLGAGMRELRKAMGELQDSIERAGSDENKPADAPGEAAELDTDDRQDQDSDEPA